MTFRGFLNAIISAVVAGATVGLTVATQEGVPTKASWLAGLAAAFTAAVNHFRGVPGAPQA